MANDVKVQIKNELKEVQKIKAIRKVGNQQQSIDIANGKEERFIKVDTLQLITIQVPETAGKKGICFKFCTKVDLQATYSSGKRNLDIRLLDSGVDGIDLPTTVNVTVGDENP